MSFVERIRQLRQQRGWSQAKVSKKLNVHQKQISDYERRIHAPSVERLIRMPELFNVSLDYIAFDGHKEKTMAPIADRELTQAVQEIDQLPTEDKDTFKAVFNTLYRQIPLPTPGFSDPKQTAAN